MYCWTCVVSNWNFNQCRQLIGLLHVLRLLASFQYRVHIFSTLIKLSVNFRPKPNFSNPTFNVKPADFIFFHRLSSSCSFNLLLFLAPFFFFKFKTEDCIITLREDFPMPSLNHSKHRFLNWEIISSSVAWVSLILSYISLPMSLHSMNEDLHQVRN